MNTEQGPAPSPPPLVPPTPAGPPRPTAPPRPAAPPRPGGPPPPAVPPRPVGPHAPAGPPPTAPALPGGALLRAVTSRASARLIGALVCGVLGTGLLGGAAAGAWLAGGGDDRSSAEAAFDQRRGLWREIPVDELFPPELTGEGAGPGGSDRRWIRVAVAPDSDCEEAFDPLLTEVLATVGCHRLVRATYTDETETSVTTVGLLFTEADTEQMAGLSARLADEGLDTRTDLLPRPYAAPGTLAADFGDAQRATWTIGVPPELPVLVYALTGFADGRAVTTPQPAAQATAEDEDSTAALAGLGHDAVGIAERVERGLRSAADRHVREP
ncbi:hypothetical protein [Streptomyces litchfieldiae]|uniref:Uncharacterized protein n=1 Tax=Streptomyces litchfieldiae TaxID=3075543 RepID=A0ABU2MVH4_9ACTN|nr:hypothetical protein [Streptomyces sp. DSM 44938]MDT0345650.1 hypothetical protein [Streptomyces sp. DSM 44938]